MEDCLYYQAVVLPENALLFTSLLQALDDHYVFYRGIKGTKNIYEFFVPLDCKNIFEKNIKILLKINLLQDFCISSQENEGQKYL